MAITLDNIYDDLYALLKDVEVVNKTGNYSLGSKALVISSASLRGKMEEWGGQFRDASITDGNIHAVLFSKVDDKPVSRERDMRRVSQNYAVIFIGLWHYKREGTIESNSDRDFNNEADAIAAALNAPAQDLPASLRRLQPFTMSRDSKQLGGEDVHFAVGMLVVRTC